MEQGQGYALFFLLFVIAGAAAIILVFRNQRRMIATRDTQLLEAQQNTVRIWEEYQRVLDALSGPERERLEQEMNRQKPHLNPPGLKATLQALAEQAAGQEPDAYEFAVGWCTTQGEAGPACMSLSDTSVYRTGHIAVTGESGHGKGTLEQAILLQLAHNTSTGQLRIQIIDPKSSDAALWEGKAHLWKAPIIGENPEQIKATMTALSDERQRRDKLRTTHRVREWHELPTEVRPPRLVVWITEVETISESLREFDAWLGGELAKARASGITYLLDLQNQSGNEMRWRKHIGTFIAGFQSSTHHIQPNIGLPPSEVLQLGGMLPTDLQRGQFIIRNKRDIVPIAAPTLSTGEIQAALEALPAQPVVVAAPEAVVIAQDRRDLEVMLTETGGDDLPITPELWAKIVAAAREVEKQANPSRAAAWRLVFAANDPKARAAGDSYRRVCRVCDAERLLLPRKSTISTPAETTIMVDSI